LRPSEIDGMATIITSSLRSLMNGMISMRSKRRDSSRRYKIDCLKSKRIKKTIHLIILILRQKETLISKKKESRKVLLMMIPEREQLLKILE
jgi:hypothetical protein